MNVCLGIYVTCVWVPMKTRSGLWILATRFSGGCELLAWILEKELISSAILARDVNQ